jgi:integrase
MAKRRGHGSGSVYRYRGGFRAEFRAGRSRLVRDFDTRREAESWLAELRVLSDRGALPEPSRVTVGQFLGRWLEAVAPSLKPGAAATYRQTVADYIIPHLGGLRLQALKAPDIQGLYGRLLERGLSPTTVRLVHAVLHKALSQAVDWGLLAVNPAG